MRLGDFPRDVQTQPQAAVRVVTLLVSCADGAGGDHDGLTRIRFRELRGSPQGENLTPGALSPHFLDRRDGIRPARGGIAVVHRLAIAIVSIALNLFGAVGAGAVSFPLNVEFDDGLLGTFGTVEVTEAGGDLDFEITLDASLGASRDLHELYFNLEDGFTGIAISSTDVVNTAYTLGADPAVAGGAGSSFDFGVNFGNGGGAPGNGALQSATFSLSADQALGISDLLISSSTSQGIEVFFAVHVQGTSLVQGATSETLGSQVPEPGTLTLVLVGLAGLRAATQRRRV